MKTRHTTVSGLSRTVMVLVAILLGLILVALVSVVSVFSHRSAVDRSLATARTEIHNHANILKVSLDTALTGARAIATAVETQAAYNRFDRTMLSAFTKDTLRDNPQFSTSWIIAGPGPFDGRNDELKGQRTQDRNGVFIPFFARREGVIIDIFDPTDDISLAYTEEVFSGPYTTQRPLITEPYYDTYGAYEWLLSAAAPILTADGTVLGVAGVDITLSDLQRLLASIRPYDDGYAIVVSRKGTILSHPDSDMLGKPASVLSMGKALANITQSQGVQDTRIDYQGQDYVLISTPVTTGDGQVMAGFAVLYPMAAILKPADQLVHTLIFIGLIFMVVGLIAAWYAGKRIAAPIAHMTHIMQEMTEGNLDINLPSTTSTTEIGRMQTAMRRFRDNVLAMRELEAREAATRIQAEQERKLMMSTILDRFETCISGIVDMVSAAALALNGYAHEMTVTAENSSDLSASTANSSEEASRNITVVASATDQLSLSTQQINKQMILATEELAQISHYILSTDLAPHYADTEANLKASITSLRQISAMVSDTINEQDEATQEVARNVSMIAQAIQDLSQSINVVKGVAKETGDAAMQINVAASDLSQQANILQFEVSAFLDFIRRKYLDVDTSAS